MHCVRKVTEDLFWVGGNDKRLHLFENIHPIEDGVSYNSYLLLDEKTVLFDTADWSVGRQFIENVEYVLNGRKLDYMVINHMEPDHCASMEEIILRYPDVKIVSTEKALMLMHQFNYTVDENFIQVAEGDTMSFGKHNVVFVEAPMVHWPEAMVTFDTTDGVLFSADAFGSFKSLDGALFADEVDFDGEWINEARRYYTNIVGKYGPEVMDLLKKAQTIDIKIICPLHGPVWRKDIGYILDKYIHWATYTPEEKGVLLCYASMYGNTENAAHILATKLHEKGMHNVHMYDVSKTHVSYLIGEAFKYSHLALLSVTYNLNVFPAMENFVQDMKRLNLQKRVVAVVENGSWAPQASVLINETLDEMKQMTVLNEEVSVLSSVSKMTESELDSLADSIIESMSQSY
ncbi:beta-lactamase [Eubacterium sulci ATCC 35585]|jgi:beta-lactamase domain protein|nr:beta-lactamase [Eubacterium sulci ATCC 35585]MBF1130838.1 FprA family A-type flavoprotein [[Eubacterium] sulci]EUC77347.1 metallo-beta-lactamase domain protein [Eubacterium sulci ATCC 35585]MBF1136856.1 FprA family A-type flavoprotein [[Eubacterium] sulci]MBF1146775.1 FprA family A-type flavoprotein [[Eubacterium] sulci]